MGLFNSRYRYRLFAIVIFAYILVQTRSSYMAPIVTLIFMFVTTRFYRIKGNSVFSGWLVVLFCFTIIGMMNNNNPKFIRQDIIAFFPFVLLLATNQNFRKDFLRDKLAGFKKLSFVAAILYCVVFAYMGFNIMGSEEGRFIYDDETHLRLTSPVAPLFFIPLVLCYGNSKYKLLDLLGVAASILMFVHFALITSTKSVVLPITMVLIMRLFLGEGTKSKYKYFVYFGILAYFLNYVASVFFGNFIDDFLIKFEGDNESNASRIEETAIYLRQCDTLQWVIGKGWGGLKTFHGEEYIGGESMIHLGFAYLIMKGGLILLTLVYYPLIYIIFKDFAAKKYAYVLIAIFLITKDFGHMIWLEFIDVQIYWLLVYYRFYRRGIHDSYLATEAKEISIKEEMEERREREKIREIKRHLIREEV